MHKIIKNLGKLQFPKDLVVESIVVAPFFGRKPGEPFLVDGEKSELSVEQDIKACQRKGKDPEVDSFKAYIIINCPLKEIEILAKERNRKILRQKASSIFRFRY